MEEFIAHTTRHGAITPHQLHAATDGATARGCQITHERGGSQSTIRLLSRETQGHVVVVLVVGGLKADTRTRTCISRRDVDRAQHALRVVCARGRQGKDVAITMAMFDLFPQQAIERACELVRSCIIQIWTINDFRSTRRHNRNDHRQHHRPDVTVRQKNVPETAATSTNVRRASETTVASRAAHKTTNKIDKCCPAVADV